METFIAMALIAILLIASANFATNYQMKNLVYKIRASEQERERNVKRWNEAIKGFLIGASSLFAARAFTGIFDLFSGSEKNASNEETDDDEDLPNGASPSFASL